MSTSPLSRRSITYRPNDLSHVVEKNIKKDVKKVESISLGKSHLSSFWRLLLLTTFLGTFYKAYLIASSIVDSNMRTIDCIWQISCHPTRSSWCTISQDYIRDWVWGTSVPGSLLQPSTPTTPCRQCSRTRVNLYIQGTCYILHKSPSHYMFTDSRGSSLMNLFP